MLLYGACVSACVRACVRGCSDCVAPLQMYGERRRKRWRRGQRGFASRGASSGGECE